MHWQTFIEFFHTHPHWTGFFAFLIAYTESLAIIGTIIPGSVTMTAVGALVGAGIVPLWSTVILAILGAFSGDCTSFWVGHHYQDRIRQMRLFRKHIAWLNRGEQFFEKHGGKSIVIGRFVGPVRSMVPLIAGMLNFHMPRFLVAAIPSATLWAVLYMLPGIIIGALSLELPPGKASAFILYALLIIVILWAFFWTIQHFFVRACRQIDRWMTQLWQQLRSHKPSHWVVTLLSDPRYPDHHSQLTLLFSACITGFIFLVILYCVFTHNPFTDINSPIYYLFRSIRTPWLDSFAVGITIAGYKYTLLIMGALVLIWFAFKRHWRAALHWLALFIATAGSIKVIKILVHNARPPGILLSSHSFSFPSGHTTLSVAIYGFLAVLIAREMRDERRWIPYATVITFLSLLGLSRIYLGAHWLTDVLGSMFLGLTWILLIALSYRRKHTPHILPQGLAIVAGVALLIGWSIQMNTGYSLLMRDSQPIWPTAQLSTTQWRTQKGKGLVPLYRLNRFGNPIGAFNLQWAGNLKNIRRQLEKHGWKNHLTQMSVGTFAERIYTQQTPAHLPILPQLYQNKPAALLMSKDVGKDPEKLFLRLWASGIDFTNSKTPLWIGTAAHQRPRHKLLSLHRRQKQFDGATRTLQSSLGGLRKKIIVYTQTQMPEALSALQWNGQVLLVG